MTTLTSTFPPYTRQEFDWIEGEWAYACHGRQTFLSVDDFRQVESWQAAGIRAATVVEAMTTFFTRLAQRPRRPARIKIAWIQPDLDRLQAHQNRITANVPLVNPNLLKSVWELVFEPLRSDPQAQDAWLKLYALKKSEPHPDAPGWLDHFDRARATEAQLLKLAEAHLRSLGAANPEATLKAQLADAGLTAGTDLYTRVWRHHWTRAVFKAFNVPEVKHG